MTRDFLRAPLGKIGSPVCRIGLSATYRPGRQTVFKALDEGLNYFLYFGFDNHMTSVLRETVPQRRGQFVLATGAYNLIWGHQNLRRTLERRLRQMRTDFIDVFHFLGVTRRAYFTPQVREELQAVRESGLDPAANPGTAPAPDAHGLYRRIPLSRRHAARILHTTGSRGIAGRARKRSGARGKYFHARPQIRRRIGAPGRFGRHDDPL